MLFFDASNIHLVDAINDRANDELAAISLIKKAIDEGDGFQNDSIKGEVKADAIIEALAYAKVSKDVEAAAYDDHVFKLASGLPRTMIFNEIVENLNWKRQTVRNAANVTAQLAESIRSEDVDASITLMQTLAEIMDNYEMATAVEKSAEKLVEELENQTRDAAPPLDAGALAPSLRNASADPMDKLLDHFATIQAPPKSHHLPI